ncbi:MAG: restriction endonuclease, partial [Alphaproteobacteria bacterium]
MAIPDYQGLMLPLLELVAERGEIPTREAAIELGERLGLSEEERQAALPSGERVMHTRTHWAATYLVKA